MKNLFKCGMGEKSLKPFIAVIIVKLIYTGQALFSKASIAGGLKPSIFAAYQQAFATIALAPFAFFLERNISAPLTFKILCKIFFVAVFGMTVTLNLTFSAMNFVSATFVMTMGNTVPAVVFILAIVLRLESLAINKWYGRAKVIGCVVCLSGAMMFTFFKGPPLYKIGHETSEHSTTSKHTEEDWIKGFFLLALASFGWALWIIMQGPIQKEYPCKLRLTCMQCCFSSITSAFYAAATQRNISSWKLGWDLNLISVAYCGVIVNGLSYWMQVWIIQKKGPVFVAIFGPLALVFTAISSALIFKEILHLGSVLGGIVLVAGLYSFLWGTDKEAKIRKCEEKLNQTKENVELESITTCTPPIEEPAVKQEAGGNR